MNAMTRACDWLEELWRHRPEAEVKLTYSRHEDPRHPWQDPEDNGIGRDDRWRNVFSLDHGFHEFLRPWARPDLDALQLRCLEQLGVIRLFRVPSGRSYFFNLSLGGPRFGGVRDQRMLFLYCPEEKKSTPPRGHHEYDFARAHDRRLAESRWIDLDAHAGPLPAEG